MIDKIDILIAIFLGSTCTVGLLCAFMLFRGGMIPFGQETRKMTTIQKLFTLGIVTGALDCILMIVNDYMLEERSAFITHLVYCIVTICFALILPQAWVLQQKKLTLRHWLITFAPFLPEIIVTMTIAEDHPKIFFVTDYLTNAYVVCMILHTFYRLKKWDEKMEDMYSEISHKQTLWFRRLQMPYLLIFFIWIPIDLFPSAKWLQLIYYFVMIAIFVSSTSHALAQEEFVINDIEGNDSDNPTTSPECTENNHAGNIVESDNNANSGSGDDEKKEAAPINVTKEKPHWANRLEPLMTEQKPYRKDNLTSAELAAMLYTNRTYLSRYLNDYLGMTFYDYVNKYRLDESEKLILEDKKSVTEIATFCGFKDHSSFYRAFRKRHNMSPSEWLRQHSA